MAFDRVDLLYIHNGENNLLLSFCVYNTMMNDCVIISRIMYREMKDSDKERVESGKMVSCVSIRVPLLSVDFVLLQRITG